MDSKVCQIIFFRRVVWCITIPCQGLYPHCTLKKRTHMVTTCATFELVGNFVGFSATVPRVLFSFFNVCKINTVKN